MNQQIIISIGRQYGSAGHLIGAKLPLSEKNINDFVEIALEYFDKNLVF